MLQRIFENSTIWENNSVKVFDDYKGYVECVFHVTFSVSDSSENIRQQHKETARGRREKREEQRRLKERKRGLKKRNPIKKSGI